MTGKPSPALDALRRRLAGTRGRAYWQSLEQAADSPGFAALIAEEFPQAHALIADGLDRRRMLQLMASSLALAGLAGCGPEEGKRRLTPYIKAQAGMVPGAPRLYASATTLAGYGTGVLVKHVDGRPIKIEGNPAHPASMGATSHWSQATILGLYDPERSPAALTQGRIATQDEFATALAAAREMERPRHGAGLRLLTGSLTSSSLAAAIEQVLQAYPDARWHQWEAVGRDNPAAGARLAFGRPLDVVLHIEAADVILGVGADFLSTAPGHLRYARDFAGRRRAAEIGARMSRLYAIESTPTLAGAMADHCLALTAGEIDPALRALAVAVGAAPADVGPPASPWVAAAAEDLLAHRGAALVQVGAEQPPGAHALAHAINASLQAPGRTLDLIEPVAVGAEDQAGSLASLVADMEAGKVETLLIMGCNPVFTAPADLGFAEALRRVRLTAHLGEYADETAVACGWHLPQAHELEAWGDCRAFDGTASLQQPQVEPFYDGITAQQLLALWQGELTPDGRRLLRDHWRGTSQAGGDFEGFWHESLRLGVVAGTAARPVTATLRPDLLAGLPKVPPAAAGKVEILFRPDEGLWDGRFANNGWLQEMPRWHSKLVWDNAALVAPKTAERLGLANGNLVTLAAGGRQLRIPIWILPGQAADCVTLPLGFGRRAAGNVGNGTGFDAYALRDSRALWQRSDGAIAPTRARYRLVSSQHAWSMAGRDLIRTAPLAQFLKDPDFLRQAEAGDPDRSLYPAHRYEGNAWAMSINLNACIGCSACVVACEAENNTPVVGKAEADRGRLMQWLRIDRYYSGPLDAPDSYFQPVPCMHCEQAPCEVVCPVQATVHDSEGLNVMVYNRCVGTRFCSNNCPYKVRRFNFFGYASRDPRLDEAWNPDVTVRQRGVMEKCTYCMQRIREARIAADREDRAIRDGEVVTACQAACPTEAIVFGDRNDPGSAVARRKQSPLDYVLLAELNTRPRTSYEARLANRNPAMPAMEED